MTSPILSASSAFTRRAERLVAVVPQGELAEGYATLRDAYEDAVAGDEDDPGMTGSEALGQLCTQSARRAGDDADLAGHVAFLEGFE